MKLVLLGVILVAASSFLGYFAGMTVRSPAQILADTAPPRETLLTESVGYRALTRTVTLDGQVERRFETPVLAPAVSGEAQVGILTRLPLNRADRVNAGALVAEVSGRPVFVLPGRLPAYRSLMPGSTGLDVRQLQSGLRAIGLYFGAIDGRYGTETSNAVATLYSRNGYEPVAVGVPEVADAQSIVREAERNVQRLGQQADPMTRRFALEDLERARQALVQALEKAGVEVPLGEISYAVALPAVVQKADAAVGEVVSEQLLTLAAGPLVVRATLPSDIKDVRLGARAKVLLGTGKAIRGRVAAIGVAAAPSDTSDVDAPAATVVTVVAAKPLGRRTSGEFVRVTIAAARSERKEMVVPVSAVFSSSNGSTWVSVVEGARSRRVEVAAGFVGDGFVQVVPASQGELGRDDLVAVGSRG